MIMLPSKKSTKRLTTNEFIIRSTFKHFNRYDYSLVKYFNSITKVKIICNKHGYFFQIPVEHLRGCGCPKCGLDIQKNCQRSNELEFVKKAVKIHGSKYDYSLVKYTKNNHKIKIVCKLHGVFHQTPSHHLSGCGCQKCKSVVSKSEMLFLDFVKVPKTIKNRQLCINRLRVDGIKGKNVYEFLGDYWHGNSNRFNLNELNTTTKKTFGQLYQETFDKFNRLKNLGYNIYYIWEQDWKNWNSGKIITFPIKQYR